MLHRQDHKFGRTDHLLRGEDYTEFATDINNVKAIHTVVSLLKAAGHFDAPNVPLIGWDGPIIENTEFKFINFFQ